MTLVKFKEGVARDQWLFIAGRVIESGCVSCINKYFM